jgi:hypothetical protein
MTKEEKQLLLQDLCARLPHKCKYKASKGISHWHKLTLSTETINKIIDDYYDEIKPYLRPMSSMTEEEKEELKSKCTHTETEEDWEGVRCDVWGIQILDKYDTRRWDNPIWPSTINMDAIDWLNAHHFDYRGLIEKGLAIEVTEENNPYKD